ncbi:Hsp33 family molecular chaperone HslO [Nitrosomonas aestuarii]|uniref:Molecular chaperone Hsp33 n=1 Tax=Nitrosomonas aestuarii TaxID=52441 RepID=A0A1I3ZVI3_9PROT|nr:Hsp33 family molecular chaperone HslO [Nitrosomonas aestuarii]PTN11166.1 molecular chaperone Hsp33 [Nitrosomonas aestuarii]SFK47721.1 molecular chaperone Hsp33 [Nitrosomonas aestuarii]
MNNYVQRFLLENLDIRGAVVHLDSVWQKMLKDRRYPDPVMQLLGEMSATTLLLGDQLKQTGRLTVQLKGDGPISMLVIDCDDSLHLRGMAKYAADVTAQPVPDLLGHGQLVLTLDMLSMREAYQSIVPLNGDTIAEIFEHYFKQSEQLPSRLFLTTSDHAIFGILLQKLPDADQLDPDGWTRVEALTATAQSRAMFELTAEEILTRLFVEETIRIFDAQSVSYGCHEDPTKIYDMLQSLGREEVNAILRECGEVVVHDDICNREYRFDAFAIDAIFREAGPTIH